MCVRQRTSAQSLERRVDANIVTFTLLFWYSRMLWLLLLALCSLRASGNGDLARTHLYEEQLLMQELQVDQQHTQQKLQAIQQQRQFAPPGSPESLRLDAIQTQLLFKLQQATSQFQDLQAKLQLRFLNQRNPHAPSAPYLFRPPPSGLFLPSATAENEIRRRQSQQPQTPNKFPPPPPPPKPTPPPTTTTTTPPPPPPPTFETPERGICNYRGRQTCTQQCNRRNQQSCQQQCNNQQRNQRNNARSCVQQCLNSQSNCQQECIGPIQVVCLQQCNVRGEQASCLEQCSNTQNCARQCNASRTEPECLQECSTQNQQDCFQECGIQRNRMNCLQSCEEQENEENCPPITTTRPPPPRQQSSTTPATRPFNPTPSRPTTTPPPVTIAFNPSRRPVTTTVAPSLGTVPFNPPRTPPPRPIVVSPTTIQFNPPPPTIRPIQFTTTPAPIIFTTPPRPIQQFIQPQQQQQFVQQPLQNPIQQQPQFIQQPQFVQTTTTTQQQLQPQLQPQLQQIQPQIQQIQPQIQQQIQPQIQQQIQPQQFVQQTTSQFLQPNQFQQLNQLPVPQAQVQQLQPQIQQIQQQQQQVQQQIQPNLTGSQCRTSSGGLGTCLPVTQCVTFFTELADLRRQPCSLGSAGQGVCCPPRQPDPIPDRGGPTLNGVIRAPSPPRVIIPNISPAQLDNAGLKALQVIQQRLELAAQLFAAGIFVPQRSPANFHQEFFQTTNDTLQRGQQAQSGVEASISLVQDFQLTPEQGAFALPTFSILNTVIADTCPPQIICDSRLKYRTADGSCNNLQDGRWGRAGVAHQRILPPKYGDGVNSPRSGSNNQVLPSSRSVSRALTGEGGDLVEDNLTLLVMQWGQFLDHDLTHTPISKGPSQSGIACCTNGRVSDSNRRHPDCFPITLPPQDPVFTPLGEQCMEFVRSLPAPRPQCNFGPREQMNQITGYLDGSNVYGSSAATQRELRLFQEGFLKAQQTRRSTLLLPENRGECTDDTDRLSCFKAGDGRVNEQIQLTVMHTVWMREHNRIAPILGNLNPTWTDEQVFQETRRIVIAQMQHITYNEWLPILLGTDTMERLSLLPLESGTRKLYDSNLNAGVTNVFATAAFRFGHSLVRDNIEGFSQFGSLRENLVLSKNQFSPFILYKDGAIDDLIRGMLTQQCQRFDRFFSKEVTDRLFQGDLPFGLDLVALNIQRGRDHGIPPYNDWREVCGRPRASSWQQLANDIDPQTLQVLQQVYSSVEEIDLFAALVSERPQTGALLGPTLVCLLSDQFARLRRGDRFFYEEEGEIAAFSPRQLAELKKSTLARVLCDNSDDVIRMQPRAFFKSSFTNQRVDCTSDAIPRMDLSPWAGEPVP